MFTDEERVTVPRISVSVYRPVSTLSLTGPVSQYTGVSRSAVPNTIRLVEIGSKELDSSYLKDFLLEETTMFGKYSRLNVAVDPGSDLFMQIQPNDHIQIRISNRAKLSGTASLFNEGDVVRNEIIYNGAVWKAQKKLSNKGNEVEINSWDYLRMMQFYNIPRNSDVKANTKQIEIDIDSIRNRALYGDELSDSLSYTTRKVSFKYSDHFLDYLNEAVMFYTRSTDADAFTFTVSKNLAEHDAAVIMLRPQFNIRNNNYITTNLYYLTPFNNDNKIGESLLVGQGDAFKLNPARTVADNNTRVTKLFSVKDIKDRILDSNPFTVNIFRIVDAFIDFSPVVSDDDQVLNRTRRVIVDIVSVDQFSAASLITTTITADHALNTWYTPLVVFDTEYVNEIVKINTRVRRKVDNTPKCGQIVYARIFVSDIVNFDNENSYENMRLYAVFNLDTFPILEYLNMAEGITFYNTLKSFDGDVPLLTLLSYLFASVGLPQEKAPFVNRNEGQVYRVVESISRFYGDDQQQNTENALRDFNVLLEYLQQPNITPVQSPRELFDAIVNLRTYLLSNIASFVSNLHDILSVDSNIVNFITSMPASYVRAEEFTGSKFKVFMFDSLPIPRIIQVLSSSIHGLPATNNPSHAGKTGKVDNYPVFITNRVIIEPEVMFCRDRNIDDDMATYYLTRDVNNASDETVIFVLLNVGFKKQVSAEEAEQELQLSNIEELNIVKGSSTNHMFVFSFGEHAHYIDYIIGDTSATRGNEARRENVNLRGIKLLYAPNLSTDRRGIPIEDVIGITPPEMTAINIADITQNDRYDPFFLRYSTNTNFGDENNAPYHSPLLVTLKKYPVSLSQGNEGAIEDENRKKVVFSDFIGRENAETEINNMSEVVEKIYQRSGRHCELVGEIGYVDISDLKTEIEFLNVLANSRTVGYHDHISSTHPDLFESIKVVTPYTFRKINDGATIVASFENKVWTLKKLLNHLKKIMSDIDKDAMRWLFPIHGYIIEVVNLNDEATIDKRTWFREVSLNNPEHRTYFEPFFSNYFFIAYVDLLVKGIRYLLWSISKSRLLLNAYMPLETTEMNNLSPATSIVITVDNDNTLTRSIYSGFAIDPLNNIEGMSSSLNFLNSRLYYSPYLTDNGVELGLGNAGNTVFYISKRVIYANNEGVKTRIYATEGSFDWTITFDEFNLMTAITENYLVHGTKNFKVIAPD